jgi:membrane protein
LKRGFGLYLYYVPTYQAVYGALALLPVFLLWMYLVWLIVLVGAEITAALPEWRAGRRVVGGGIRRSDTFTLTLSVLEELRKAATHGNGMRMIQLQVALGVDPGRLLSILEGLKEAAILTRGDNDRWHLSRDLRSLSLFDLCRQLGLVLSDPSVPPPAALAPLVSELNAAERKMLERSVEEGLSAPERSLERPADTKTG